MGVLEGEQVLMRIFIGEADKHDGKPLYHRIVELLRHEKLAGATVLRGISGFGPSNHVHTAHILSLSQDLPIVIEVIDSRENIDRVMPMIDEIVGGGLITLEDVKVVRYAPKP